MEAEGDDLLRSRARTSGGEKLALVGLALARSVGTGVMPRSAVLHAPPLPEAAYLVEAAAIGRAPATAWGDGRTGTVIGILAQLEAQDRGHGLAV